MHPTPLLIPHQIHQYWIKHTVDLQPITLVPPQQYLVVHMRIKIIINQRLRSHRTQAVAAIIQVLRLLYRQQCQIFREIIRQTRQATVERIHMIHSRISRLQHIRQIARTTTPMIIWQENQLMT